MKHLLFSIPYGLGFRNLVCCNVVDLAIARGASATVLLPALPARDVAALKAELPRNVDVRELKAVRPSLCFTYLKALKQYHYSQRTASETFQIKYQRRRQQQPVFHRAMALAERIGERLISERAVDSLLQRASQPFESHYRRLLAEIRPDVVAITKPGYHPDELPLTKAARFHGIPTIAVDTTWDNMASKRPPYIRPQRLTVWNDWMRTEAIDFYRFEADTVALTSGTQFDVLFQRDRLPDRRTFLSGLGLDPDRKLIVFSLNAPMYAPDNPGYIRLLLDGIRSGAISGTPNLVIRLHPFDRESRHEDVVRAFQRVHLQRAFTPSTPGSAFECLPSRSDVSSYGALMAHADVLINQASTTSLDAMSTDTPVVNIAFDLTPTHADSSIARVYGFTHYKRIVDSGAVRLVYSPDELFATLNAYLADRGLDSDRRRMARGSFVTFCDGRSAERIAAAIGGLS